MKEYKAIEVVFQSLTSTMAAEVKDGWQIEMSSTYFCYYRLVLSRKVKTAKPNPKRELYLSKESRTRLWAICDRYPNELVDQVFNRALDALEEKDERV